MVFCDREYEFNDYIEKYKDFLKIIKKINKIMNLLTGCCGHIGSYLADNVYKIKKIKKTILVDNIKSNRFCSRLI